MKPTDALPHPKDWETTTVARDIEIKRGISWSKEQEHAEPRRGRVPVIRIGNVQQTLELDDLLYISGLTPAAIEKKQVNAGWSVMVGSNGNRNRVGNAVFVKDSTDLLFASFLIAARPKPEGDLKPEYFYRWLTSEQVQAYLSSSSEGTTGLNNLSHSFFRSMAIPVPSQTEQEAIASILDAVDTAIERTRVSIEQATDVKTSLVQKLFEKGLRGEAQRKTAIGLIPKSWSVVPINSVVTQFQYGLSVAMDSKGKYPILRMGNIQAGEVLLDDLKYIDLPEKIAKAYLLNRGDVLFNRTNSQELVGKVGIYRSDKLAIFASYLIRLFPDETQVENYYLGQLLVSYPVQCRIKRYATPGVQQVNVNAKNLGHVLIPVPFGKEGLQDQREIAAILEQADEGVRRYKLVINAFFDLKRALMHDLLTGKVRVNHAIDKQNSFFGGVMTERGYVELPVIRWLSGDGSIVATDKGLGWTYRDEASMEDFERPLEDPLVETLLIEAIIRINRDVTTKAQARMAVSALRKAMSHPDKLTANRTTLDLLRDGASVEIIPGESAKTVQFIEFDPTKQSLNDYSATNQYRIQGVRECRDDTVLLVNGIPLVIAEYKSYIASGKDWTEGVHQLHRYQRQAPLMLTSNVFCIAADEDEFRYGTILFHDAGREEIERHMDWWGRWLSLYPNQKGFWNEPAADDQDDPLEIPVKGLLRLKPCHVLDFLQHFVVFETKKGKVAKKIARYQQFEAVNDIVDRTVSQIGRPVTAQDRTGLIWHTQGSGKSLTMIFAAYKLRRHPALNNPTVLIVVDRRDLKTQLSDDFDACDYPSVEKALGVEDLKHKLRNDWQGTAVTTIQSFQQMDNLPPRQRDNIISLVDECHRSQKGKGKEGYAMTMRVKLPNAFRYGLTGTPIDRTMTNTHRDFGPMEDGQQERYLSFYGIKRAIKDGATLEVHYIRDKVPFQMDEKALSIGYEEICEEMEIEDEEAKDLVQRKKSQWRELARHKDRIDIVLEKLLTHFLAHPDPNGFKAQLVAVDRLACVKYKDALDIKLKERGLPTEWSDVIISPRQNDEPTLERFHYTKQKADELIDYFKLTPAEWEKWNGESYGDNRSRWRPPLKILIVCDRLLTGFDAPVEQVMYLDKPLRDHNLLQAIARTNRPLPTMDKRTGLVIDYFGVFQNLEKALNFDENIREESLIDWDALKALVPGEMARCVELFADIKIEDTRDCLLAALRCLGHPEAAKNFEHNFKSLERLWEAVAPDPCLYDHRRQYNWLCGIYIAHKRRQRGAKTTYGELAAKTRQLIEANTEFLDIVETLPVFKIDSNYVTNLEDLPSPADKAAALEASLTYELTEDDPSFTYHQLGERLKRIKERKDATDEAAAKRLRELQDIADEAVNIKEEPERLNLKNPGEYELFSVLRSHSRSDNEEYIADCARRMVACLKKNRLLTPGWSHSKGGRQRVERSLLAESWRLPYAALGLGLDEPHPPFLTPAVVELAKADQRH